MSSESDLAASLATVQIDLYRYGGPIVMAFGTVSCILSLLVFMKKNLRKNPCSIYLIAYNICDLLLIYTSVLSSTLSNGYSIDPGSYSLAFCRLHFYTTMVFDVLSPSFLLLASFDRVLVTSANALTRQRSTARLAYICIIVVILIWSIFHGHILIFTNIIEFAPGFAFCFFELNIQLTVISYYSFIIKAIVIPFSMITLGLWTVKNVRSVARVNPATVLTATEATARVRVRSVHSKDHQLIKILLIDTSVYLIFTTLVSCVLIYQQFTKNRSQNYVETLIQGFLFTVGVFATYIPICIGCYTNTIMSKTFRQEVKNILMCK